MKASGRTSAAKTLPDAQGSPSPARRFALAGPSVTLDPRFDAFRQDVADIALAGQVIASHYAEPWVRKCGSATALLDSSGVPSTEQLAAGDLFAVLDCNRGLAWGYRLADHRVGYVDIGMLTQAD